jgi:hypothetical protein
MIRSNIDGLGPVLRKFDERIKELERAYLKEIKGGENIRITRTGRTAIINASPAGDSSAVPVSSVACDFVFQKYDSVTPPPNADGSPSSSPTTFNIRALGGTINGLLPDNYNNIGSFDSDTDAYVTLRATADTTGITTLTYESSSSVPNITPQYADGAPPSEISFFAFMCINGQITSSLCRSLNLSPEVAYLDQSSTPYKNICTWSVTNIS